jgi:parvulin-like peptidyl-prolyl isomerase
MLSTIEHSPDLLLNHIRLSCQVPQLSLEIAKQQIITQVATQRGIEAEDHELQHAADQFRQDHSLFSAAATWDWLKAHQLSIEDLEKVVRQQVVTAKVSDQLIAPQVEAFYAEHQLDYIQIIMREVMVPNQNLAMELFCALQEREISFWDVANQYIQDPELRRTGGYRGPVSREDLPPPIAAAVFAARPPQVLKPVLSRKQSHLIFVEALIKPVLDEGLRSQIQAKLFDQWLDDQIQKGYGADILNSNKFPQKS